MNQIFRVIWNHATQSWVAVSELTKAHKKQSRNSLKAVLGGALVLCSINTAEAGVAIGSTSNNTLDKGTALASDSGVAIGKNANASKENNNIAIGDDTYSNGAYNIVMGKNAVAGSDGRGNEKRVGQSVAIGGGNKAWEGAKAFGDQSVALGANTLAYGNSSIAIGNDDVDRAVVATTTYTNSDGNKVTDTVGAAYTNLTGKNLHTDGGRYKDTKSGEAAIAIGVKAQAGDISVALGTGAQAEKVNAVALGSGATATFDNSVALGGGSTTDKEGTKQTSTTVNGHTYNWSGGSTTGKGDVVSIGKAGFERQLKNVAAGEVSETSTDGINGSQLYGILKNMTLDPTFLYAGDDADKGEVTGADADAKKEDATKKKIVVRSMKDGRLNLLGGADKTKLSDGNIGVNYENGNTLTFKLAKDLKGLDSTDVGGIVTNADGINMNNKPITNVAGNLPGAKKDTTAPTTASEGPSATDLPNITNNAATVGDVLNAGWNLQNNGEAKDFVKPYDTVNFIDGEGTTAEVETTDGKVSNVTYHVNVGAGLKVDDNNNVTVDAGDITNENGAPKVADADKGKVATVDTVAKAINDSYWIASATKGDTKIGTDDNIKPSTTVTFDAGKNIEIEHSTANKFTFKTVDNPEFTGVDLKDKAGNKVNLSPTADGLKLGKGDNNEPTNITNVTSGLKPYAETAPDSPDAKKGLVDLSKPEDGSAPTVSDNTAATVGDLRNMGWIVGAPENGYVDTVKNANKVDFKGENGISVTGKTNDKGVREITISVAEGKVTNDVTVTKADGKVINGVKGPDGKIYEKGPDGKPDTSKEITLAEGDKVNNEGSKFVSGNAVATAIQESGWNIGKADAKDVTKAFEKEAKVHDKVNPNDDVKFVDGQNTVVKMVTVDAKNEDGSKKATTFVKVDVTGLPVQYTDKNGTPVTKVGDKYFTVDKDGNPTTTEVKPADLTTNMVNPAAKPNEIGAPTTLGNVKSNLPETKNGNNPTLNQEAPTDEDADKVKNNAATVSDVLNAGWNLQNNGEAKDFVKPYDTVNFIDGDGTTAVVTTTDNKVSTVKYNINLGAGLEKGPDNKINIKTDGDTITVGEDGGLKVNTGSITVNNEDGKDADGNDVKAGTVSVPNADQNKVATVGDVANAINKSGFTLTTSANGGEKISGTPEMINPGKKVEMVAGKNMTVKQESNGKVTYATASNVTFDSVQFGDNGPKITNNGGNINVGTATGAPTKITGVAPGEISATSKDAVNGSQLYAMGNKLQGQINKLGNRMNAGMATSAAMANLLQPHKPGQSVATAGVGQHKNQSAVAVGYSRISDNGKYGVRFSMGANTQGEVTGGAAVGYFW